MRIRFGARQLVPVGGAVTTALLVGLLSAYAADGAAGSPTAFADTTDTLSTTATVSGTPTDTPTDSGTPTPTETPTPTDTATPTETPTPTGTPPDDRLLPDMFAVRATDLQLRFPRTGRRLRFTSSLADIGLGPLELRPNDNRPCPPGQRNATQVIYRDANLDRHYDRLLDTAFIRHRAGCMVYHPSHHHWHFTGSARYTLLAPAGVTPVVSTVRKVSFCMRDSGRVPVVLGRWRYPLTYDECGRTTRQGVSVGWMDTYQRFLPGQSLPFPTTWPDGTYCLRVVVDPLDHIVETDELDNVSVRAFAVTGTTLHWAPTTACDVVAAVP